MLDNINGSFCLVEPSLGPSMNYIDFKGGVVDWGVKFLKRNWFASMSR